MSIDLDAYFRRIGHVGGAAPRLETLAAIHLLHPQAIAFENLDPLMGRAVRLDADALAGKLVASGRGGYCFEHNLLFMRVLEALGFRLRGLGARVLWGAPEGTVPARSHMLLRIDLEGATWLADVGFGGMTPTAPLRLELDAVQATPHGPFQLVRLGEDMLLRARVGSVWTPLYRFDLQEQFLPDYEIANWYCSTSPASFFTTNLLAARPAAGCRYGLRNNELSIHRLDGSSERRILRTPGEIRTALTDHIGLAPASLGGLEPVLERLTSVAA
jgi:N-hydroxyarylamine O-acetyltransferase